MGWSLASESLQCGTCVAGQLRFRCAFGQLREQTARVRSCELFQKADRAHATQALAGALCWTELAENLSNSLAHLDRFGLLGCRSKQIRDGLSHLFELLLRFLTHFKLVVVERHDQLGHELTIRSRKLSGPNAFLK